MYFPVEPEKEVKRKVVIACEKETCDDVFIHTSPLTDNSPRVEETCTKCGLLITMKLSSIDKYRILSTEIVQ